jgi:hypothetical protein
MAKKLKTARYWTRKCPNCGFEYPNWFVSCPKCHAAWNEVKTDDFQAEVSQQPPIQQTKEKTIKIIAQIAEMESQIKELILIFSADNGISWFQMPMVYENDYFVAEIANVPISSVIIYYLKGTDDTNEEFIEDNNGEFYYYQVTEEITQNSSPPDKTMDKSITPNKIERDLSPVAPTTNYSELQTKRKNTQAIKKESDVIFSPLNELRKDTNLKACPSCNSKIKTDWSVCPICGYRFSSF